MAQIKISIVTVVFNGEKTIEKAIQSVLEQSYSNIEYIIIDGQSSDKTIEIIRKYSDNITKWISEPDEGIYDAMNKGMLMATGEVIAFLNSDDWYQKDAIEYIANQFNDSSLELLFANVILVDRNRMQLAEPITPSKIKQMNKHMLVYHPATFVRRKLFFQNGGFDIQYRIAADYEWIIRVLKTEPIIKCTDKITTYFSSGGVSYTNRNDSYKEARAIALSYALQEDKEEILYYFKKLDLIFYYRDILNRSIDIPIFKELKNFFPKQKIYVFGTGRIGDECYKLLCNMTLSIVGFVDNNFYLWGRTFGDSGLPIFEPKILNYKYDFVIIASVKYEDEIKYQLEDMGFKHDNDFILYSKLRENAINKLKAQEIKEEY